MRAFGFLLLLFLVSLAPAQDNISNGVVKGMVIDEASAPIENVEIALTNQRGYRFVVSTISGGDFRLTVPGGTYSVRAEYKEHRAWQVFKLEKFEVKSRRENKLVITLKIDPKWTALHGTPLIGRPTDKEIGAAYGTVMDELGAVVPNSVVRFVSDEGTEFTTRTSDEGQYFVELPIGTYSIVVKFSRNFKAKDNRVKVSAGRGRQKNIVLICRPKDDENCRYTH